MRERDERERAMGSGIFSMKVTKAHTSHSREVLYPASEAEYGIKRHYPGRKNQSGLNPLFRQNVLLYPAKKKTHPSIHNS